MQLLPIQLSTCQHCAIFVQHRPMRIKLSSLKLGPSPLLFDHERRVGIVFAFFVAIKALKHCFLGVETPFWELNRCIAKRRYILRISMTSRAVSSGVSSPNETSRSEERRVGKECRSR